MEQWSRYTDCWSGNSFHSLSWRTTSRTEVFDRTLRLDINRLISLRYASSIWGQWVLSWTTSKTMQLTNDVLNNSVTNGANMCWKWISSAPFLRLGCRFSLMNAKRASPQLFAVWLRVTWSIGFTILSACVCSNFVVTIANNFIKHWYLSQVHAAV